MAPACDFLHQGLRDELLPKKKREDLPGEHLSQAAVGKSGKVMEAALSILASLGHQEVDRSRLVTASILSKLGKKCRIRANVPVRVTSNEKSVKTTIIEKNVVEFETKPGYIYVISTRH